MRNDHQVLFLRQEAAAGVRVVLDGDLSGLARAVDDHWVTQRRLTGAQNR